MKRRKILSVVAASVFVTAGTIALETNESKIHGNYAGNDSNGVKLPPDRSTFDKLLDLIDKSLSTA